MLVPLAVAKAKTAWRNAMNAIKDGGGTNLTAGWMLGRDELTKAPEGFSRRLLLLTDGQLNVGIVDPVQVQGIAASGLERQGIRTSCLGFGDGYNETLLGALAKATNGDFHDADSPEKLPAIFAHELDGLQALAVQNLRVRLKRLDFCEQIFGLNDYPFVTLPDGRTEVAIGDLVSEEERVAVFALEVLPLPLLNGQPVASLEGEALLEVELAWDEISATGIASKTWSQIVRVQATQNPAEVKANETVLSWVAVQRAAKAVREASARAAAGDEAGARHQLDEEIKLMESAGDAPVVREALGTLREAQAQLNSAENSSRKGKLMFSLSSGVSRQSSRRRPSGPTDTTATRREPPEPMWILTTIGFFSIVQKPRQTGLTIRARVAADLDRLRVMYLPTLSATITGAGTDYPYRAIVGREEFALALAQMARDITYANFKGEVARRQGHGRERTYSKVWGVLQELEGTSS